MTGRISRRGWLVAFGTWAAVAQAQVPGVSPTGSPDDILFVSLSAAPTEAIGEALVGVELVTDAGLTMMLAGGPDFGGGDGVHGRGYVSLYWTFGGSRREAVREAGEATKEEAQPVRAPGAQPATKAGAGAKPDAGVPAEGARTREASRPAPTSRDGITVEMIYNKTLKLIETAYPPRR